MSRFVWLPLGLALGGCPPADIEPGPLVGPTNGPTEPALPIPDPDPLPAQGDGDATVPVYGGTLATVDGFVVVADPGWDQVKVIAEGKLSEQTVSLSVGTQPFRVVIDDDTAFVTLRGSGEVVAIDLVTATVVAQGAACAEPRGIDVDGEEVFIACANGELVQLTRSLDLVQRQRIDTDLRDVVVNGDEIWLSRFRDAEVLRLQRSNYQVLQRTHPDLAQTDQPQSSPRVGWRMRAHPSQSGVVLMHLAQTNDEIELEPEDPRDPKHQENPYGGNSCDPGAVRSSLHFTHVRPGGAVATGGAMTSGGPGYDFAFVDQDFIAVPVGSVGQVVDFGIPLQGSGVALIHTDDAVSGPECRFAFPELSLQEPGIVTSVGELNGEFVAFVRDPSRWVVLTYSFGSEPVESSDSPFTVFHATQSTGLACATCHPEGQDDGHVWNFEGLGPRRTQNLSGGVASRAPFHWDGEFPELTDLMSDVFEGRMGGSSLDAAAVEDLAAWMDGIRPVQTTVENPNIVAAGQALFEDPLVGCQACHVGEQYSNFTMQVVREGEPATKTPSLLGVGSRAPYMHDGCASTLEERFTDPACGGGDFHGVTSGLSEPEIDALVAFLKTL